MGAVAQTINKIAMPVWRRLEESLLVTRADIGVENRDSLPAPTNSFTGGIT